MPKKTRDNVIREARAHPSGTYLIESNNLNKEAIEHFNSNGGERLPFAYP